LPFIKILHHYNRINAVRRQSAADWCVRHTSEDAIDMFPSGIYVESSPSI
jgi:hypothetical protein